MAHFTTSFFVLAAALCGAPTRAAGPPPAAAGANSHGPPTPTADVDNEKFANITLAILACIAAVLILYRLITGIANHFRKMLCLNNASQAYFAQPTPWFAALKRHLIYAPLFGRRHHHELRLTRGWPLGVLPTRFQSLLLAGIIAMNITLAFTGIEWNDSGSANMLSHLRNRSGSLAVANMIPLVIMAGRNNPLITLTGLSYDTFNMFHRWFGRIVAFEALVHVIAHVSKSVNLSGWNGFGMSIGSSTIILTGVIAFLSFVVIILTAVTALRRAFYEAFCHVHILLVITALVALWYHLDGIDAQRYLKLVIAAWALERLARALILAHRNLGRGGTTATVELLPGDAMRVTLRLARPWRFAPGQHAFLTVPAVGLWTAHPFSLAWSDEHEADPYISPLQSPDASPVSATGSDPEKALPLQGRAPASHKPYSSDLARITTTVSAVVRRRDGFTAALHRKALAAPNHRATLRAVVEGPYGGASASRAALASYGTVLLLAGGVGITHVLPTVRALVAGHAAATVATRRLTLVWIVQSPEHLEWVRPWMTQVLAIPGRRDVLRVLLFVTRPRSAREIRSPSATVQMFPGRPNVARLVERECDTAVGAVGVGVCGPGTLADDTRRAVRAVEGREVGFVEESFSW